MHPGYHPVMPSIDQMTSFADEVDETRRDTWEGLLAPELGMIAASRLRKKLNAYFANGKARDFFAVPDRPSSPDDSWFESQREQGPGEWTRFAVQVGERGDESVGVLYTNRPGKESLGMWTRLTVAERDGTLKIIGEETRCSECHGAGCKDCRGSGWSKVVDRMPPFEASKTKRLNKPGDPESQAAYEALD